MLIATKEPRRISLLINKLRKSRKAVIDPNFSIKYGYQFYTENYFKHMVSIERKRTERSGSPFMLMLIDIGELLRATAAKKNIYKNIFKMLGSSTREIDIKGWYKKDQIVGILYIEIKDESQELITDKVHTYIRNNFTPQQAKLITVNCLVFPHDDNKKDGNYPNNNKNPETKQEVINALYKEVVPEGVVQQVNSLAKRSIDLAISIVSIVCLLPFFAVISFFIKISSRGPVIFTQERIGQGGKPFKIYKFRTMYQNNSSDIHKQFITAFIKGSENPENREIKKIKNDPRVTGVGRLLRKTSVDELPQLFNVLIGNMSLVGPRPPLAYEVEKYDTWHKRRVFAAKPGITGLWQVVGRSITKFDDMVRLDIHYIQTSSVLFDLKLILKTPLALLRGAY